MLALIYIISLHLVAGYLVTPPGTPAPGANSDCSEWVQDSYALTCDIIEEFYGITAAEFEDWNPSTVDAGSDCTMLEDFYYCVQINYVSESTLSTSPPSTFSTPDATISTFSSTTSIVSTSTGQTTSTVSTSTDQTTTQTTTTEPSTITTTTTVPSTTTSTTSGDGISTPTPYQTGMATDCTAFQLVVSGDTCDAIVEAEGISLAQFYEWNPAVGDTCSYLDVGDYVCVDVVGVTPTPTSSSATSTTSGDGVSTPTPYQSGMVSDCDNFHLVVSGDTCYDIAEAADISLDDFYLWNPAVGNSCAYLDLGDYVCIGVL